MHVAQYINCANRKGFGETVQLRWIEKAFSFRMCDKHHMDNFFFYYSFSDLNLNQEENGKCQESLAVYGKTTHTSK